MDQENRSDQNERRDRDENRNWWWWLLGAGALLVLGLMMYRPMLNNRNTTPTPISDRGQTGDMSPSGTPITDPTRMSPDSNTTEMQAQLNQRAADAAKSVDGVRDAWAVTMPMPMTGMADRGDTVAMVGVSLESSIRGESETATLDEIKTAVENIQGIDQVVVSSAPTIVNRIRDISDGITRGEPMSKFEAEMNAIMRDMVPTAER